jgi:hypothetical protein
MGSVSHNVRQKVIYPFSMPTFVAFVKMADGGAFRRHRTRREHRDSSDRHLRYNLPGSAMTTKTEHRYIVNDDEILVGEPIIREARTPVRAIV